MRYEIAIYEDTGVEKGGIGSRYAEGQPTAHKSDGEAMTVPNEPETRLA